MDHKSSILKKQNHLMKALKSLKDDPLQAIYHLTESHSPGFRYRASLLYEKAMAYTTDDVLPMLKDNIISNCCATDISENVQNLLDKVEEMPKEWTLVQLTPSITKEEILEIKERKYYTNNLHITVFDCGQHKNNPVSIFLHAPKDLNSGMKIEIMDKLMECIFKQKEDALKFKNAEAYKEFLVSINTDLRDLVRRVQNSWLREWLVLFQGKYVNSEIEESVDSHIEKILNDFNALDKIEARERILLKYVVKGVHLLDIIDFKKALSYCLQNLEKPNQHEITTALYNLFSKDTTYRNQKRHPIILIVDEKIDPVPWEMIKSIYLNNQPTCRMQSLYFTYALFKEHENEIVDGYHVKISPKKGSFILNPSLDLLRMETRLKGFFNYWTPNWSNIIGRKPTSDEFMKLLTEAQIFCYNGHGDGFQFLEGSKLQKLRIDAVALLFGCGSVKLQASGTMVEPIGSHQNYITACSPCVVGMLWNITDKDMDVLSTDFLSRWIPSDAVHWKNIDMMKWERGEGVHIKPTKVDIKEESEPDLLKALLKAKVNAPVKYTTKAACVARGIPIRLDYN